MSLSLRTRLGWVVALITACGDDGGGDGSASMSATLPPATDASTADPDTGVTPTDGSSADGDASAEGTSSETGDPSTTTTAATTSGTTTSGETTTTTTTTTEPGTGTDTGTDTGVTLCMANEDPDAPPKCNDVAPPDSFDSEVQWTFTPADGRSYSQTTPLVANLTDDNGDGAIDLCDTPDVVLLGFGTLEPFFGRLYVLDGATGALHFAISEDVHWRHTPALGDIDGDGLVEIVAESGAGDRLLAFEHDGTLKWQSDVFASNQASTGPAVALADVDNDGDVEIVYDNVLLDHTGKLLWTTPTQNIFSPATAAADLDGDGDLEIVHASAAYYNDGTQYYASPVQYGYAQIANFDADPEPEVMISSEQGLAMLEHDGTVKYTGLKPVGGGGFDYARPATIHDFDGDMVSEFAVSSASKYTVYEGDATVVWTASVADFSGSAGSTAFDFLGDGVAEAMYGDEQFLFIYDGNGAPLVQEPRSSATITEYPVVVDVDNDGSAEILVVSSPYFLFENAPNPYPTLQVIRDKQDRWVQARRIWNQHTYHVTNVREDGTIPQFEPPSWQQLNTYRTNAQLDNGMVCAPEPQ